MIVYVAEHVVNAYIVNIIWLYFLVNSERRMNNNPLKQRKLQVKCFVKKQNVSLEIFSLSFRCVAGSADKDYVSSITGTLCGIKEKKNEVINLSPRGGK